MSDSTRASAQSDATANRTGGHDARALANFLLDYASGQKCPITIMALLKILYFAHGWHLAKTGAPLVRNNFEAWQLGPVVRIVWECFRDQGDKPITSRATKFDPIAQTHVVAYCEPAEDEASLLRSAVRAYGWIDAMALSQMTHRTGSPWDRVWNAPDGRVVAGMRISNEAIRQHFLTSETWQK